MLNFPENIKHELESHSGILFNTTAYPFETEDGKAYSGYYGYDENRDLFFRINFPIKRTANIVSHIDFFTNMGQEVPDYSIIPIESTISNIVTLITKSEKEPFLENAPFQLQETLLNSRREQLFKYWVDHNSKAKDINYLTTNSVEDVYSKSFLSDKDNVEVPLAWFRQKYKEYLSTLGIQLKRGRKTQGKRERIIDDLMRREELLGRKENFDFKQNLEILKKYTQGVIDESISSLLIYGPPGSGKSHIVNQVIQENSLIERRDYVVYQGGVSDARTLVEILYNHGGAKDGKPKLILFDDFSIPKDRISVDILAQVMDSNKLKSEYVTYGDKKIMSDWEKIRAKLDIERDEWIDKYVALKGNKPTAKEVKDFEKEQLKRPNIQRKTPPSFPFYGRIIIITNNINIDPKLLSRTLKILIDPTNTEILSVIKKDNFDPEVSEKTKKEVIALLEYISSGVPTIDFRDYFHAVIIYELLSSLGGDTWKNKVIDNILMKEKE